MADDEKVPVPSEEKKSWLPNPREGEHVFGVAHIFASFNDTFVHVTDLSGKETIVRVTGKGHRFDAKHRTMNPSERFLR